MLDEVVIPDKPTTNVLEDMEEEEATQQDNEITPPRPLEKLAFFYEDEKL